MIKSFKKKKGKKGNNKRKDSGSSWTVFRELSVQSVNYSGPIRNGADMKEQDLHTVVFNSDGLVQSDGAVGFINAVFSQYPGSPGGGFGAVQGWSSAVNVFDEYRTLGFEIEYVPFDRYNRGTTVFTTAIVGVIDYDSSTALTSYGTADSYSSMRQLSLDTPWRIQAKMSGIENATFTTTASSLATGWFIKLFSNGLTLSTAYGRIFYRVRVQFRGRGI